MPTRPVLGEVGGDAAGDAVIARTEIYLTAAQAAGYRGTLTAGEVRDCYDAERGLRLDALGADAAALAAAASGAEEALRAGEQAAAVLRRSWRGESATAAADVVERQCVAGAGVVAGLADAAVVLTALRETLTALVDAKVEAVVRIDERRAAERSDWLAAAHAVLGGTSDRAAGAMVKQRIVPYLDGEVGADMLPRMRSGTAAVSAAYDEALTRLRERPHPRFEQPIPPRASRPRPGVAAARAVPAAAAPPEAFAPSAAAPSWSPSGGVDPGSGLAGLVSEIAGLLGGYSNPADPADPIEPIDPIDPADPIEPPNGIDPPDGNVRPNAVDGADPDDPVDPDEELPEEPEPEEPEPEEPGESEEPGEPEPQEPNAAEEPEAAEEPAQPLPAEAPAPQPEPDPEPEPLSAEAAESGGQTPCEIAADELPQVGR